MKLRKWIAGRLAQTRMARRALEEKADLSAFREKPSLRLVLGVSLIGLSFLIAWPAITLCGIIAVAYDQPMVFVIGAPAFYATSWLVWALGMYLTGAENAKYGGILLRWALRRYVEKYAGK